MGLYTYDDFDKERQKGNYKFSNADLKLAQQNPDAGMAILDAKKRGDNSGANSIRSSYGGYTGGANGGSFNLNPLSPASYNDPGFNDQYGDRVNKLLTAMENQKPFQDTWGTKIGTALNDINNSKYQDKYNYNERVNNIYSQLENRDKFSYDLESDPSYQAYRSQYLREGQRAAQNTMAQAATMTGGRPSSYAATAAAQQQNYYNAQLTDKIPELYQQAYDRYMKEFDQQAQLGELMSNQGAQDFYQYNQGLQNKAQAAQLMQGQQTNDWNRYQGEFNMKAETAQQMASQQAQDYYRYNQDRTFGYNQLTDEVENQRQRRNEQLAAEQAEFNKAVQAYQYGDDRLLKEMGIDTSKDLNRQLQEMQIKMQEEEMKTQQWQTKLQKAQAAAQVGDYSLLQAMGFDTSKAGIADQIQAAQFIAQYTGDFSELRKLMVQAGTQTAYDPYKAAMLLG